MLYFFDNKEKLIGFIDNQSSISITQTEPLRGVITLEASFVDGFNTILEQAMYVGHVDAVNDDEFQLYKIQTLTLGGENEGSSLSATHVVFDELKARDIHRKVDFQKLNISAVFMEILKNSRWKLGECNSSKTLTLSAENTTSADLISKIIENYSVELRYRLKFVNNKIVGRFVDVFDVRGRDTYKRYAYGHNALKVVKEINSNSLYTAIIPRGKEVEIDEHTKEKIDISKVTWSKASGNYVDKPYGSDTLELKELSKKYGFSDDSPRTFFKNYDTEDANELIKMAYDDLVTISRPKVEFSAIIEDLGELNIGDSIVIVRKDLDIYYKTRVFQIKRDLLQSNLSEITLGDNLDLKNPNSSLNKRIKQIGERLESIVSDTGEIKDKLETIPDSSMLDDLREQLKQGMYDHDSYNYFLKKGNEFGLPPGFYAFNKPIEENPTSGIWMNGGKMAIANTRNPDGTLNWSTWLNGDGIIADYITAGILQGGSVRWNLEDGTFLIGKDVNNYKFYWDGSTLHMRDVDIDLRNNSTLKDISESVDKNNDDIKKANDAISQTQTSVKILKDSISTKVSKTEILSDKEIQGALSGVGIQSVVTETGYTADSTTAPQTGWYEYEHRNLLLGSAKQINTSAYQMTIYYLAEKPIVGEDYTLTIWGSLGADRKSFGAYNSGGTINLGHLKKIADGVYQATFKWANTTSNGYTADDSHIRIYQIDSLGKSTSTINKIKLEKGTSGTDWSASISDFSNVTSAIKWYRQKITLTDGTVKYSQPWRDGAKGEKGEKGDKGDTGLRGLDGLDGKDGIPGGYSTVVNLYRNGDKELCSTEINTNSAYLVYGTLPIKTVEDNELLNKDVMISFDIKITSSLETPRSVRLTGLNAPSKYKLDAIYFRVVPNKDYVRVSMPYKLTVKTETSIVDNQLEFWGRTSDVTKICVRNLQIEIGTISTPFKLNSLDTINYTHIAYSNSADGKTDFSITDSTNKIYIGMYVDNVQADSSDYTKYRWTRIKGEQGLKGDQGIPGKAGADGKTPYLHIAYSNSTDGKLNFSTTDSVDKSYIGQYTDFVQADSTDHTKYKWSLIKGTFEGVIGARNYLLDSAIVINTSAYQMKVYYLSEKPITGEDYTLTIWGSLGADRKSFGAYNSGGTINLGHLKKIADGVYQATFKWANTTSNGYTADDSHIRIYQIDSLGKSTSTINKIKLEKGNTGTDWSPAPEDLLNATKIVRNEFESFRNQTNEALTDKVSIKSYNANNKQIQQQISNVTQTANSITQRVSNIDSRTSDLATKYSQIQQTANGIASTVSSVQGSISKLKADTSFQKALTDQNYTDLRSRISSIKQTTDSITLTVSSKLGKTEVQSLIKQTVDNITIKASQIDFSGNVSITGELRTKYYSGNTALWMKNDSLKAYEDNTYNNEIGYFGGRAWSDETYPYHLSISHGMDYHTTISYEGSSNYHPYILFDAYNNVDPSFVDSSGNATIRKHQYDPVGGIKYMMRELHTERNYFTDKVFHQDHVWVQKDLYFGNGVGIERAGRDDYVVFGKMSQLGGVASGGLRFMNNGRVYTEGSVFVNNEIRWNANYPIFFGNGYGVQLTNSYIAIGRITSDGTVTDGIYIEGTELRALRDNQLGVTLN